MVIEKVGKLTQIDLSGSQTVLYPVTTVDAILGLDAAGLGGPKTVPVTLAASGWSGQSITVYIDDIDDDKTVMVSPDPDSHAAYGEAGVYCYAQEAGALTFKCESTPAVDLVVNVGIFGAAGTAQAYPDAEGGLY